MLSSVIEVLGECFVGGGRGEAEGGAVLRLLGALAQSGRFSLTSRLLAARHKQSMRDILAEVSRAGAGGEAGAAADLVRKAYGVKATTN